MTIKWINKNLKKNSMISYVEMKLNKIIVYNEDGKRISEMPGTGNVIEGISSDFFLVRRLNSIITYDENCDELARMTGTRVEILCAAGRTFTTKKLNKITLYDQRCLVINQRTAWTLFFIRIAFTQYILWCTQQFCDYSWVYINAPPLTNCNRGKVRW